MPQVNIQVLALRLLEESEVTPKQLSQIAGVRYETARENLIKLENAGFIKRKNKKLVFEAQE